MCGITGIFSTHQDKKRHLGAIDDAVKTLNRRGPDHQASISESNISLGHARLSIIDLDPRSNQPMTDISGRYTLVFNGEIYNYRELKAQCVEKGIEFHTESDTEVLLAMFILHGKACLDKLIGFFGFAIYDRKEQKLFVARDRFGIKPIVFYADEHTFAFASEMKALMAYGLEKSIDKVSLFTYLKLNYIPAPHTILNGYKKLGIGSYLEVDLSSKGPTVSQNQWYKLEYDPSSEKDLNAHNYQQAQKTLKRFVRESIRMRLVADVPVGTFLSGGIDSSIITTIAAQEKKDIEAFSIGFPDQPFFDETEYAKLVAAKSGVKHHIFNVSNMDLFEAMQEALDYIDEPFADASALPVYLLSKKTKQHVKVCLSGDGADEVFSGYHKHMGEFRIRHAGPLERLVAGSGPLLANLPASRSNFVANKVRQLQKFSDGFNMTTRDRYWRWAGILREEQANYLLKESMLPRTQRLSDEGYEYKKRKDQILKVITKTGTMNEVLLADMGLVLPNDMLFKVDHMSMANSLEVRTPFLDHRLVQFAFRLPEMFKINASMKKKILQDAYRTELPDELYNRPKKGFEVPLLDWFRKDLRATIEQDVFDPEFIEAQGLFNLKAIAELKTKLFSQNPGDTASTAWAFIVFQHWYKKNMD